MKSKRKIVSILLLIVAILCIVFAMCYINSPHKAVSNGIVKVELIDISGEIVNSKKIEFNDDDTLPSLLETNFSNVKIKDGMLLNIDNYVTPDDWSEFISIYVNGQMNQVGINEIKLANNEEITLEMTKYVTQ